MAKVVHFCLDQARASGVNTFCTELNHALNEQGFASAVIRDFPSLSNRSDLSDLVLHLHGLWHCELHRASIWARKRGIPVVWSTHGMTAPWAMRHKGWKKWPAWFLYQKRDLREAVFVHCTSAQEVSWNGGFRCVVIPLGTRENGETALAKDRTRPLRVLFVGRIHPVKGLMNLAKAARMLEPDVEFRIVGPDENGYMNALRDVGCRFDFAGPKFGEELSREYDDCDILVLPSESENFGGVVVDALAHGRPVIASRSTPWKILEDRQCGWWVDNGPASLAKTIAMASKISREELGMMGARGRNLVRERFTWESVSRQMIAVYEKCLKV